VAATVATESATITYGPFPEIPTSPQSLIILGGKIMKISLLTVFAVALMFCVAANSYGQGHGRGGGGGNGNVGGGGHPAGGPPSGVGVDRGLGSASIHSNGRSDTGLGNASTRSNARSDAGLDRARMARENANRISDTELNRYRGLSRRLGTSPNKMRAIYQQALLSNPNLTYGNFVAANVIADNMNARFPNVTATNILGGLANGDSLGQTLRNLRLTKEQSKIALRDAEDAIDAAKKRNR
jgi:hypothetical protein